MPREAEPGEVRVVSWNVNGLRSLGGGLESVASELSASLLCVQETKLSRESLDSGLGLSERGSLYFSFCRSRPGYSGVATFAATNATPAAASDGLGASLRRREEGDEVGGVVEATEVQGVSVRSLDAEGRALLSQHRFALPDSSGTSRFPICVLHVPAFPVFQRSTLCSSMCTALDGTAKVKNGLVVIVWQLSFENEILSLPDSQ